MSQSLSQLYVHITYHIKTTSATIRKEEADELYAYIAQFLNNWIAFPLSSMALKTIYTCFV